ncbi:glycerate kinase [Paenibacillus sp. UNC451MF]|uniref:glycerate kinase n=1 Tax=Paenibacillus sp. UNC451MF TaxID=1449063 RepID=UPI00048C7E5E|nr:glycerate kinase [Paenibacillus sp. UNC451MF]
MRIVLAPDSYKGSLSAKDACDAMELGIRRAIPDCDIVKVPMADGGEGTVRSLVDATEGSLHTVSVQGPLGEPVSAVYGILGDGSTAVIEVAEASGLYLIDKEYRNPLLTTTYGMGELIRHALDQGCRSFIIGLGGSATNDGGAGMAQALGVKLLNKAGQPIGFGGDALGELDAIDIGQMDPRVQDSRFIVACDVDNPLCGSNGASAVFGPQKGATPEMVTRLDSCLMKFAEIVRRDVGTEILNVPGAGAAGGMGGGAIAFLNAELKPGVEIVIEAAQLEKHLKGADLVLSGEGQCDFQTERGKTPYGVAKAAQRNGVPCVLIAGSIGKGIECLYDSGVISVFSMVDKPMALEQSMQEASRLAADAAERVVRLFIGGRK